MILLLEQKQKKITGLGNSGCQLEILQGKPFAIKKTASSGSYIGRLNNQRIKQQNFSCPIIGIQVPKVLSFDQHSFTMELLPMLDTIDFFERADPETIRGRIKILIDFIRWEIGNSILEYIDSSLFHNKLLTIKSLTSKDIWQFYYALYEEIFIRNLPKQIPFLVGNCHGDLTLSNIMFSMSENQIGMIDFLDSFIDSPLVDIAKLLQDAQFHWSSHHFPLPHDRGKIHIINSWLYTILSEEFSHEISTLQFWIIQMMNYFRIIPYINSPIDHEYIARILARISLLKEENK